MSLLDPGAADRKALADRISDVEGRLGHLFELLNQCQRGISELQSRPLPDDDTSALRVSIENLVSAHHELGERVTKDEEYAAQRLDTLTLATAEGIERVTRSERRVNATVARARKELAGYGYESPGLEAEAAELRPVDADGGANGEVPALRADVVETIEQPPGIPGRIPQEILQALRDR